MILKININFYYKLVNYLYKSFNSFEFIYFRLYQYFDIAPFDDLYPFGHKYLLRSVFY
jgi:hypothetical protein